MTLRGSVALAAGLVTAALAPLHAAGLGGSPVSMRTQHEVAVRNDYSFFVTSAQVDRAVEGGYLVSIEDNADFSLSRVSFPVARPDVALFIERFAAQYHDETGGTLVVTSLTRPSSLQPRNAHALSVHPTGMAVDLRIPSNAGERAWIERTLLSLETSKVLDVTRERSPAHYHIAIYPEAYRAWAAAHPMPPRPIAAPVVAKVRKVERVQAPPVMLLDPISPLFVATLLLPFAAVFALRRAERLALEEIRA